MVKMLIKPTIFVGGSECSIKHRQIRLQNTPNPFGHGATMGQKWTHKTIRIFSQPRRKEKGDSLYAMYKPSPNGRFIIGFLGFPHESGEELGEPSVTPG